MSAQRHVERVLDDLKSMIEHGEDLIKDIPRDVTDRMRETRDQFAKTLSSAKGTCRRLERRTLAGAKATDEIIHERPYQFIGGALAVGLLIGVLISRR